MRLRGRLRRCPIETDRSWSGPRWLCAVVVCVAALLNRGDTALADAGTVCFSNRCGAYQVSVFISPQPFRSGPVDISIFLQDGDTGETVLDADVTLTLTRVDPVGPTLSQRATREAATNKLLYASHFELPAEGRWQATVFIRGSRGEARAEFDVQALAPLPPMQRLWPWIALPIVPIVLFVLHVVFSQRPVSRENA
ncbi:MAG: hypothetical protein KatS3mg105_2410 [Gemmatales bacterium]|nr:MAG: hypothetical protein KatS3mg105_2410 [Gemmatales bacterium]